MLVNLSNIYIHRKIASRLLCMLIILTMFASMVGCGASKNDATANDVSSVSNAPDASGAAGYGTEKDNQVNSYKEAKTDQKNELDSDKLVSDNAGAGVFKEGNGLPNVSVSGTYDNGYRKAGVTPVDPSIGNYHGYDGSKMLTDEEFDKAAYGIEQYTGFKHNTWTASNGVVLWLVDDPYCGYNKNGEPELSRSMGSIYDCPITEEGTKEYEAVMEFILGEDDRSYNDYIAHKDDINNLPGTPVRDGFTDFNGCTEAYFSDEMKAFRKEAAKINAANLGVLWTKADEETAWATHDIETNGRDTIWQTNVMSSKAWQLRYWPDDGTGTSSWQLQIYQGLSAIQWKTLETVLKTCVVGPVYKDVYNRIYNDFYIGKSASGIDEWNTQYTFNGYNISCEYIEPQYGYVEYWIWE